MSQGPSETVECPLCGAAFDPSVAGGWCTNAECGEWRRDAAGGPRAVADGGEATAEPVDDDGEGADPASSDGGAADDAGAPDGAGEGSDDDPTLDCPDCGTAVAAEDNFCRACGADVSTHPPGTALSSCPGCGGDVEPADSFCRNCGERLDAYRSDGNDVAETETEDATDADADDSEDEASLVLVVRNREIQVTDGDTVGKDVRSVIMDTGGDEDDAVRVHREHVRFEREDGQFYLVDLGRNPTVVNGDRLDHGDRVPVSPGDRLELSNVAKIRVQDA